MNLKALIARFRKPLPVNGNSPERVRFRQSVLLAQKQMGDMIESGILEDRMNQCSLKHYFTPIDKKFGCAVYAREIFIPKGTLVIGKIHRHQHLNFIMKGKVSVNTEFGKKYFEAPCTFISESGLKRAVYAEEDTIWTTLHLTENPGEQNLDKIENEVISPTYEEIGLLDSVEQLRIGESR